VRKSHRTLIAANEAKRNCVSGPSVGQKREAKPQIDGQEPERKAQRRMKDDY
jgi:hypothetical protein